MGRGPCTFKKSDVTRAVEAVIAAGIAVQKVEIDCEAKKMISGKPPEEPNTSAEWDDLSCAPPEVRAELPRPSREAPLVFSTLRLQEALTRLPWSPESWRPMKSHWPDSL